MTQRNRLKRVPLFAWRLVLATSAVSFLAWVSWMGGRTLLFYYGPSEKLLSQTGFDIAAAQAGSLENTIHFEPKYPLWSDGATKQRYVRIPPGTKIDNSNPDRWNFPVGTRVWKAFAENGRVLETRMLYKVGPESWEWDMAVYQPTEDRSDSVKLALAKHNVGGSNHDIPAPSDCVTCHSNGKNRKPLGTTALQIPWVNQASLSLTKLNELGLLTNPPAAPYAIPGSATSKAVLGYLDTNCGSCHYEGSTYVSDKVPLRLNLTTATLTNVEATNTYRTTVNQVPYIDGLGTKVYILPGDPSQSFLYRRMSVRDNGIWQMPPLATEFPDEAAVSLVKNWILSLRP